MFYSYDIYHRTLLELLCDLKFETEKNLFKNIIGILYRFIKLFLLKKVYIKFSKNINFTYI